MTRTSTANSRAIFKVLRKTHPDLKISKRAMLVMNALVDDVCDRISLQAARFSHYNIDKMLGLREIQTAARLLLPGELSKYAVSEGTRACVKFAKASRTTTH